jgi:hypothetical protein
MSYVYSVSDRGNGRELLKHDEADGSIVNSYQPASGQHVNGFSLNGDSSKAVAALYTDAHVQALIDLESMSEDYRIDTGGYAYTHVASNGDLLFHVPDSGVERRSQSDGSLIASYGIGSLGGSEQLAPASDGGWFLYDVGSDTMAKFGSAGTEEWTTSQANGSGMVSIRGTPDGGVMVGGSDDSISRRNSDGSLAYNVTPESYRHADSIKIDDTGHAVYHARANRDIIQITINDGTKTVSVDEPEDDSVYHSAPTKDAHFYGDSSAGLTKFDDTGSVVYQVYQSTNFSNGSLHSFPDYAAHPSGWETTVVESAVATKMTPTTTQNTAVGSIVASASVSPTSSNSTPLTAGGAPQGIASATTVASSATMQSASVSSSGQPSATKAEGTSLMRTVDTSVPAVSTKSRASTSTQTATGTRIRTATASTSTSSAVMHTPSAITETVASESNYGYVGDSNGLYRYNPDGTRQWSKTSIRADNVCTDSNGTVYVTDSDTDTIYAFDETGAEVWHTDLPVGLGGLAVGQAGTLYYYNTSSSPTEIHRLDASTGAVEWTETWSTHIHTEALDVDENLYVGTNDARIRRYNRDGSIEWTQDESSSYEGNASVETDGQGHVYVHLNYSADNDGRLREYDISGGFANESQTVPYEGGETLVHDGGQHFYIGTSDYLAKYDWSSASNQWETSLEYTPTEVDVTPHGNVYVTLTPFGGDPVFRRYDDSDGALVETIDAVDGELGMFPEYAANQDAWTPMSRASVTASKAPTASTTASPSSLGTAGGQASKLTGASMMATPASTGAAGGTATMASGAATAVTPGSRGTAGGSATKVPGSAIPSPATGARVTTGLSTKVNGLTTMQTAVLTNLLAPSVERTSVSGGTITPTVTTTSHPTAQKVGTAASPAIVEQIVIADGRATKYEISTSTWTPFEFERQVRSLENSLNDSPLTPSQNDSTLTDSDNATR